MRRHEMEKLRDAKYPVIARVPERVRKESEIVIPGIIEGVIVEIIAGYGRLQSSACIRYGLGQDVCVYARNVIRLVGRGWSDAEQHFAHRVKRRKWSRKKKAEQMKIGLV